MNIPKTLKIGCHLYKVICPYEFKERGDLTGQQDPSLLEIRIDNRDSYSHQHRADSTVKVTLIHEILHAIDSAAGLNELNGNTKEQERIVEALAQGLCQVFTDNEELVKIFL
jgi:hypothetical protein